MGAFLEKPKTDKETKDGSGTGLKYGSSAMQGWRMEMEDADVCCTQLEGRDYIKDWSFFGVFDGHAGHKGSKFCADQLWECIKESLPKNIKGEDVSIEDIKKAMSKGFFKLDEKMRNDPLWANGEDHSGTTSVVVLVTPRHIIWANCGDSRSIFCRGAALKLATTDHKPSNEIEKTRIEKAGGTVMMQRVNGTLAVSRALGDFDYKRDSSRKPDEQLVSPEPDIYVEERVDDKDEFLVLACDGIYDVMTNEEVLEYVRRRLHLTSKLSEICSDLIDKCLHKNSRDNMSVILVTFPAAPKVSEEAIQQEKELQEEAMAKIMECMSDMVASSHDLLEVEENHVIHRLSNELPSKYDVPERKDWIIEKLQTLIVEKYGTNPSTSDEDFTGPSDPSNAPAEMQIETAEGTFVIQPTKKEDDCDAYDPNLLQMNNTGPNDEEECQVNDDRPLSDGEEKMDTSEGEDKPLTSPVAST